MIRKLLCIGFIREQDPLKQGLKRSEPPDSRIKHSIREQDPLKQGLKPCMESKPTRISEYSRARSIKTRIETYYASNFLGKSFGFESKIH